MRRQSFYDGEIEARQTPMPIGLRNERRYFESLLEARWALTFELMGIEWRYEPQRFELRAGYTYTPDFYLEDIGWIEIKPEFDALLEAEPKLRAFTEEKHDLISAQHKTRFFSITAPYPSFALPGKLISTVVEWLPDGYRSGGKAYAITTICAAHALNFQIAYPELYSDHVDRIFSFTKEAYFDGPFRLDEAMLVAIVKMERRTLEYRSCKGKDLISE